MGSKIPREQVRTEKVKMQYFQAKIQIKSGLLQDSQSLLYSKDWKISLLEIYLCTLYLDKTEELNLNNDFLIISNNQPLHELIFLAKSKEGLKIYMLKFDSNKNFIKITAGIFLSKRPSWILSPVCHICSQEFDMIKRCHHCRYCGKNICASCSKFCRLDLLGYINVQRLCVKCVTRVGDRMKFVCEIRNEDMSESMLENLYDLPYNQSVLASTLETM
ncbi:hypothetical protein SteCoe_29733 [Stentor coeruleus]|uniref:FYVE-type domain-containing protein n=1 Tax=Stentor coeruleus TaxID=5963 RepID=A0A1R2B575_9CILI|nr:hypothetical protein SteCoe_29733 [Stentor coeruleus]